MNMEDFVKSEEFERRCEQYRKMLTDPLEEHGFSLATVHFHSCDTFKTRWSRVGGTCVIRVCDYMLLLSEEGFRDLAAYCVNSILDTGPYVPKIADAELMSRGFADSIKNVWMVRNRATQDRYLTSVLQGLAKGTYDDPDRFFACTASDPEWRWNVSNIMRGVVVPYSLVNVSLRTQELILRAMMASCMRSTAINGITPEPPQSPWCERLRELIESEGADQSCIDEIRSLGISLEGD